MKPIRFPRLTFWKGAWVIILALGIYSAYIRFTQGLGAATNLNDDFPWGLWIGFDVLVGVGLAAGGFVITGAVYIFGIRKLKPIARPAVLTAFLGYVFVAIGLLFDLGKPHCIWHPMVMWNPHSVMFEVAWCVMLYTTVLFLEFSPSVLERFHLKTPLKVIKAITIPVVMLGVILSTLHQSSLGSLYLIVPDKLHGLWYSPYLPLFFFISAVAGGLAMVIFESFMSHRAFNKGLEQDLLAGLAKAIVVVLGLYLCLRLLDLSIRGNISLVFAGGQEPALFLSEIGLGVILPIILLLQHRVRRSERGLFFSSLLVVLGFIMNRLNVSITGMQASLGRSYMPSLMEAAVSAALVGTGFAIFAFAVKHFSVFPSRETVSNVEVEHAPLRPTYMPSARRGNFATWRGIVILLCLGILLAAGILALSTSQATPSGENASQEVATAPMTSDIHPTVSVPESLKLPADYVFPLGKDSLGKVTFRHATHVRADALNCERCHPGLFKMLEPGVPIKAALTIDDPETAGLMMEPMYDGAYCGVCHNGVDAFSTEDDCERCHAEE